MSVVADTSPLNYLILIGEIDLLEAIYGHVTIPTAVFAELKSPYAPPQIRGWAANHPDWLDVRATSLRPDATLARLEAGEQEAILLAEELGADPLLMDERKGRRAAEQRGLRVVGVLGVLDEAADRGLVEFGNAVARLQQTSYRVPRQAVAVLLARHRKSPPDGPREERMIDHHSQRTRPVDRPEAPLPRAAEAADGPGNV